MTVRRIRCSRDSVRLASSSAVGLAAVVLLSAAAGCGGAGKPAAQPTKKHFTATQRKYMGSQYCTEDWNHGQTPSGSSPPVAYGQFLTIYPTIRIYEIPQTGAGVHPKFTCALIAATRLDQISDVYANTFDGNGWQLDQTDAHSMQVNGVSTAYPPNAFMTVSGQVRLRQQASSGSSASTSGNVPNLVTDPRVLAQVHEAILLGGYPSTITLGAVYAAPPSDPTWVGAFYSYAEGEGRNPNAPRDTGGRALLEKSNGGGLKGTGGWGVVISQDSRLGSSPVVCYPVPEQLRPLLRVCPSNSATPNRHMLPASPFRRLGPAPPQPQGQTDPFSNERSCGNFSLGYRQPGGDATVHVTGGVSCLQALAVLHEWYSKNNGAVSVGPGAQDFLIPDGWECGEAGALSEGCGRIAPPGSVDWYFYIH